MIKLRITQNEYTLRYRVEWRVWFIWSTIRPFEIQRGECEWAEDYVTLTEAEMARDVVLKYLATQKAHWIAVS